MVEMKYFLDYFLLYQLVEKIMEVHKQSVKFLVAYLFFLEEKKWSTVLQTMNQPTVGLLTNRFVRLPVFRILRHFR